MSRGWGIAVALFALLGAALVAAQVTADRAAVVRGVEERTRSVARLIASQGQNAIDDALEIVDTIAPDVAAWDFADARAGEKLFRSVRNLVAGSHHISSAWVVDATGISRLDSWSFPPKAIDGSERPYYRRHRDGAADPLIAGDAEPGSITNRERFTVSRALRHPGGALRAIVVVGIYSREFETFHQEAASWPEARAGLYTRDGDVLARLSAPQRASPEFIRDMHELVAGAASGSAVLSDRGVPRLASWQRSAAYPDLYGSSSQTLATALAEWQGRSLALAAVAGLAILGFALYARTSARAAQARQVAEARELAIREVHHRVKNALQLLVSMIELRLRTRTPASVRAELEHMASQICAVADVQDLLQGAATLETIDTGTLLHRLCEHLQQGYRGNIVFSQTASRNIDPALATSLGIVVNELLTNAMKHGRGTVEVTCGIGGSLLTVTVRDDGPGLPAGFDLDGTCGFGLRTAALLAENTGARLSVVAGGGPGAAFRLDVPLDGQPRP